MLQAEKLRRTKNTPAGGLQLHRQLGPGPADAVQDVVEVGRRRFRPGRNLGDGLPGGKEAFLHAHGSKCNSEPLTSQGPRSTCRMLLLGHHCRMWTQLESFRKRLKEYQAKTGKTQAQVSVDLGTSYGTLRFWLSGTRPPGLSTLQNAANLFGCSVTEFIDDPAGIIAGQDLSDRSEQTRFLAGLIVKDLALEDLTDEDRDHLYRAFAKERDWVLARKARRDGKGS